MTVMNPLPENRVWKGIFGIQNSSKIRCRIQENPKYLGRETGFDCYPGSGLPRNLGRGIWDFIPSLSGTGSHDDSNTRSSFPSSSSILRLFYRPNHPTLPKKEPCSYAGYYIQEKRVNINLLHHRWG